MTFLSGLVWLSNCTLRQKAHLLVYIFDSNRSETLGYEEFVVLIKFSVEALRRLAFDWNGYKKREIDPTELKK